jgi:multidrug efflux system outer membrane protein
MQNHIRRFVIFGLSVYLLSGVFGCTVGPNYRSPDTSGVMEESWQATASGAKGRLTEGSQPMTAWWDRFHDEELSGLIKQLLSSNLALAQAEQRIVEVSAQRGVVEADKRLQLAAALGYTRAGAGEKAFSFQGPPAGVTKDLFSAGVTAGWELDLWGHTARLIEAAGADIGASYADYHGLMVSLAAELTQTYVNERTLEARLAMVRQNIDLQEKTLKLAENRYQAGNGTALAVERSKRLLQSTRARIPEIERAQAEAQNRIKALLGLPPSAQVLKPGALPAVPRLIGLGLPADLLVRRPDIRESLYRYHAAVARIGAAEAERYPDLSLSGTLTLSSDTLTDLVDRRSLIYSLGPGLHFPLLTGGRIESTVKVRSAQAQEAQLALQQKIVEALAEVESAGVGVVRSEEQVATLVSAEQSAKKSVQLADTLYRTGLGDLFQVLDNEEELVASQESLLSARQQALSDVVALYRSLGGGWQDQAGGVADER